MEYITIWNVCLEFELLNWFDSLPQVFLEFQAAPRGSRFGLRPWNARSCASNLCPTGNIQTLGLQLLLLLLARSSAAFAAVTLRSSRRITLPRWKTWQTWQKSVQSPQAQKAAGEYGSIKIIIVLPHSMAEDWYTGSLFFPIGHLSTTHEILSTSKQNKTNTSSLKNVFSTDWA